TRCAPPLARHWHGKSILRPPVPSGMRDVSKIGREPLVARRPWPDTGMAIRSCARRYTPSYRTVRGSVSNNSLRAALGPTLAWQVDPAAARTLRHNGRFEDPQRTTCCAPPLARHWHGKSILRPPCASALRTLRRAAIENTYLTLELGSAVN